MNAPRKPWPVDIGVKDTHAMAEALNAQNAHITRRADAAVNVVAALAVAALAAWALIVFLTPCEAATLCMATAIPTRPSLLYRLRLQLRAWRLRWKLRDTEATLAWVEQDLLDLPELRRQLRRKRDFLQVRLIDCDLGQRTE